LSKADVGIKRFERRQGKCCQVTKKRNEQFRTVAAVTAVIFGITNTGLAQTPVPMTLDQKSAVGIALPADFKIPETLGSIQARFSDNVPGKPFVIIVQDAHGIVDAQNNIQKIIAHLQASYGLNLIAIEGGDGKLDPTLFRTFPDEFVKKKIMDGYLRRGELTGSEMAAIFNPNEGLYHGIEDWNLYEENYFAYLRAVQKKERILEGLKAARGSLDKERLKVYSSKLNEFHEQTAKFETENTYLPQLLKFLGAFEGTKERLAQYPEIEKLFQSLEFEAGSSEKQGDLDALIRQMAEAFKTKYLSRMTTEQAKVFHKNHQDFLTGQSDPAHFLQYLVNTGKSFGLKAKLTPSLARLLGHSQTLGAIKGTRLFDELESLLTEVENALISTPEERELAKKYRQLSLLKDLASLELTRNQWKEYQGNPKDYLLTLTPTLSLEGRGQAAEGEPRQGRGAGADLLKPAFEFYRLALERDKAFRKNLAGLLKKEKSKTALVLAGGFHSQGLEQSLKEEGFSYAVITPKIQSLEGQETYADVMQGKGISYKPYLKTTFYDAFVKDASIRLASEFNEPEFRQKIRAWRDGVIRQLAKEGRIAEAKDYTRYIDLVWKVYYDKFADENIRPNARQEILRAIEKELENFRHDFLENLRPQPGPPPPQALQTHAVMNLTRDKSTPWLVDAMLHSSLSPLARSELRASSDIRVTVTALINTVFQNSSGAEVLNGKFAGFSQALLQGQDAASRQTRVNFVNFYNTLLRSLRRGSVNRRQFFDILNQVFSFTPGNPSGNLDRILTGTQSVQQNGQKVYTIDTFYNALARTLIDYGLKTPVNWQNPYQNGVNERGRPPNQFGRLDRYFRDGLSAREVLRTLAEVKQFPRDARIQAFEERLNALGVRPDRKPAAETQVLKRLGQTQVRNPAATQILNAAPPLTHTGAKTMRPVSRATVMRVAGPAKVTRTSNIPLLLPGDLIEDPESIFSEGDSDSIFGDPPAEVLRRQKELRAFLAEAQAARDKVLDKLNKARAQAKQKARSEVRAAVSDEAANAVWTALIEQQPNLSLQYEANRIRFTQLLKRKSVLVTGLKRPLKLEGMTKDIPKVLIKRILVSDIKEQDTLRVGEIFIAFDQEDVPRAVAIYNPGIQQPVLVYRLAKSEAKPAPAVPTSAGTTLTDWILERLEESDERVEIYRQGHYQVENSTELLEIETENPLYTQVTELFNRIAQPPGGEVISVITVEPGISRENLEAALARLSQDTTDFENNQFAIRHSETTLADLGGIQSQKDPEQSVKQRILNNLFSSLPPAELAQEMDSQSFLPRLVLSIGSSSQEQDKGDAELKPEVITNPVNEVIMIPARLGEGESLPVGLKSAIQKRISMLYRTEVNQLHALHSKHSKWGTEHIYGFDLPVSGGGAGSWRGYYLTYANQILVFAMLPSTLTHKKPAKVLELGLEAKKMRKARIDANLPLFSEEEREASRKFFEADLKLEITRTQAEAIAAARSARDKTVEGLNLGLRKPVAPRRRSEVRAADEQISASAREALKKRGQERENRRNNSALLSLIEAGGSAPFPRKVKTVPIQQDLSKSLAERRTEIIRKKNRMLDEVDTPLFKQISQLEGEIRKKESEIENQALKELKRELQAAKNRRDAERSENKKRKPSDEDLNRQIKLDIRISQIESEIERKNEKLERPDALKSLDKELEAKKQDLGDVRGQIRALGEELDSLPEKMKLIEAAKEARDAVLSQLNLPRAEIRGKGTAAETSEEPEVLGHILGEPDEEGWLISDDEERLFELVVSSRKIRDIYEKLEQGQTVTPEDLKLVLKWLKLGNPLAMILGERLQGGDWVVNWQVSGVGEGGNKGGLGVKQFNDPELLGEQVYNNFKFKTLLGIIGEKMEQFFISQFGEIPEGLKDQQYTRALYDDFKADIRIVKPQVSEKLKGITREDLKKLLKDVALPINEEATKRLMNLLKEKEEALLKYGIDLKTAVNLIAIKLGFAQVKPFDPEDKTPLKAKARLEAVIHSTFARELPDGIYNQENYKKFVRDTIDLRNALDREGVLRNIFTYYTLEYTDSRGEGKKHTERVIDEKFAGHLRKKTAFEKLPPKMKEAFKNKEFYEQAQAFFNRLSVQDYFIRWPLEFDKAAAEAHKILKVIQYLYQNVINKVGITAQNRPVIKDIIQKYILKDARNRGVTSPVDFHGRSPPMKGTPAYVFMDVIGLGAELGKVLTAQLGLIEKLMQEEKWDEVGVIQRNSGAAIIDKKLKMQKAIQDTYERVLEEEAETRPLLMHVGGDEVVLVFDTKGLSPDLLNILWFEIRRAVSEIGFQIRIGIEADANQYREGYGEGIKNADNFAHMRALKTSDPLTEILKGLEDAKLDEFENILAIHQKGEFVIRVETKEGIRDYTQMEVQTMLAGGQELADFNAAQAAAVANLTTDEKVRVVADPLASALTHAVLNAGAAEGEALAANKILAQALAGAVTAKPLNPEAIQKLGKLIAQVLSNRDDKQHLGKLIAALFMKSGKYPVPENVKEVRNVMQAAIDNAFEVRSLFSAEELEGGRKKYGDQAVELKAFLAKGWEQNRPVMDHAAVSNWYLAIRLMKMRQPPQLKIAPPKIVPQAVSPAAPSARSELRRIILGSEKMMEWLSRGESTERIVRKIFAEEIYGEAEQLGLGEGPQTVLLVDTIRGTVVWELAKLAGGVSPGEAAFEPSEGYKSITAQALFLLDHPELLQKMLAKSNPSADIWGRGLRLYDGALIAPIEDAVRHKEDKAHIENQLQWTTVVIAFQVGTEKKIIDILRIPGVIPLALKDDTGDLAKVGGHFEDIRMTLASGTRIKSGRVREGAAGIVYYNRLAAYLRQSNLSLARLVRLSDLALSSEEIKSKMRVQDGAHVMTPEAFNMLVDYVERLALDQEVQTAYEIAA